MIRLHFSDAARSRVRWLVALLAALLASNPAQAAFLHGETLDKVANVMALVVIVIVPIIAVVLFWIVHVLPEKIAHKRHHPQRDAIQVLCLLSLFFGGMLWPLAWLWAYSKPVLHKLAYGTDKHEDYHAEVTAGQAAAATDTREQVARLRADIDGLVAKGLAPEELTAIRDRLTVLEREMAAQDARAR